MKIHIFITNLDEYVRGEYRYCFTASSDEDYGKGLDHWEFAGSADVEINVNNAELTQKAVKVIEEKEEETRAEFEVKMGLLKEKKANLLSLTHTELT